MRHKNLQFCTQFLIYITLDVTFASDTSSHCGGVLTNVDTGEISAPFSYLDPLVCTWILTPPPGQKLLINIEQISLPSETDQLYISINRRLLSLPRHCEICWSNLEAEELNVTYEFNLNAYTTLDEDSEEESLNQNVSSEINYTSSVSFQISYQSFEPDFCSFPKLSTYSYFVGKNKSIGSTIKFGCNDPYDLNGSSKSTCVKTDDSPVPKWDPSPDPKCQIQECNGRILNKFAEKNVGTIVHPGYPAKMVLSEQHCIWIIRAPQDHRINLNVQYFSLPGKRQKKGTALSYMDIFDEKRDTLIVRLQNQADSKNLTSKSNVVILELITANISLKVNDAAGEFGFMIEYSSTCTTVPSLKYGSVLFADDISIGSTVLFQCDVGFDLVGSSTITCLPDLSWSDDIPVCQVNNDTSTTKLTTRKKQTNQQDTNSKEADKTEGSKEKKKKIPTISDNEMQQTLDDSLEETKPDTDGEENDFTTLIIVFGVAAPVVVLTLLSIGCFLWYRKQYPVRMGLGKKFETFENPAYERKKTKTNADDLAELQKLTSLPSP